MPRFSICIASYNDGDYLSDCLSSLFSQDFEDFEVVVANDGSIDATESILMDASVHDRRVVPVMLSENQGTHCARAAAVERARGDYILFLDSDDKLLPGTLTALDERLARTNSDYLHFGMEIVASFAIDAAEVTDMESQANARLHVADRTDILSLAYTLEGGYQLDWRVTQRVFAASTVKRAFESLPHERIGFAEDGLEHFAIALHTSRPVIANDIKGYHYNYGTGATGGKSFSLPLWSRVAASFGLVSRVSRQLAEQLEGQCDPLLARVALDAADGFSSRLGELLFAQWDVRDDPVLSQEVFERASSAFGVVPTAAQVMRLVRDEAYAVWDAGGVPGDNRRFLAWYAWAEHAVEVAGVTATSDAAYRLYQEYRDVAAGHIRDLGLREQELKAEFFPQSKAEGDESETLLHHVLCRLVKKIR